MLNVDFERPIQILFAGGCHTLGYPVGEHCSFPVLLQRKLAEDGARIEIAVLPHVKLSHHAKVIAKCNEWKPDILVLQLGHLELNQGMSEYLKRLSGREVSRQDWSIRPNFITHPRQFYLKGLFKKWLDAALGHPLVDLGAIERSLDGFFTAIEPVRPHLVILLSPLSCADQTAMYYRRRALPIFQEAASKHNCVFIDALTEAPHDWTNRFGPDQYYYEGMHLAAQGHADLNRALAQHIQTALPSLKRCPYSSR